MAGLRRNYKPDTIQTGPSSTSNSSSSTPNPTSTSPSSNGGKDSGKGGGKGGGKDSYAMMMAQQAAKDRKAANRLRQDAAQLNINAITGEKVLKQLRKNLRIRQGNVRRQLDVDMGVLRKDYGERVKGFRQKSLDSDTAHASQTSNNLANMGREWQASVSEVQQQGAGEADMLRASLMSLRNWSHNQSGLEVARQDSRTDLINALQETTGSAKNALISRHNEAQASLGQNYTNFTNQVSDNYTDLANIYGSQANLYNQANELSSSKKGRKQYKQSKNKMKEAAEASKDWKGKAYKYRKPKGLQNWKGVTDIESGVDQTPGDRGPMKIVTGQAAEGASLRKW